MDTRLKYIEGCIQNGWSRSVLLFQIETKYYERIGNSANNFKNTLPPIDSDLVNNTLKDPYIFDFISLNKKYKEKELENIIKYTREVLEKAIELGGTTIKSYESSEGVHENFQNNLMVHNHVGDK